MSLADLIILSLACWRGARLFVLEDGPFSIFARFRNIVLGNYSDESIEIRKDTFLSDLFSCVDCLSVWIGAVFVLSYLLIGEGITILLCLPLALSGVAVLLNRGEG